MSQLLTSLSTLTLVGILFWAWINARFKAAEEKDNENRARIRELEKNQHHFVEKNDHNEIRREDKEGIENQLREMRDDMREMPERIVSMIKQFIK